MRKLFVIACVVAVMAILAVTAATALGGGVDPAVCGNLPGGNPVYDALCVNF